MSLSESRSDNRVPTLGVLSNANDGARVALWADPTTHRLLVDASVTSVVTDIEDGTGDSIMDAANDSMNVTIVSDSSGITALGDGVKTVTTAGTDEALAGSTACKRVTIQAQTDNTGLIAVGASGVDATEATGTGIILYPGDSYELETDNLADIYIDSTVNGDGVRFTYFT